MAVLRQCAKGDPDAEQDTADGWSDDVGGPSRFVSLTADARLKALFAPEPSTVNATTRG